AELADQDLGALVVAVGQQLTGQLGHGGRRVGDHGGGVRRRHADGGRSTHRHAPLLEEGGEGGGGQQRRVPGRPLVRGALRRLGVALAPVVDGERPQGTHVRAEVALVPARDGG